MRATLVTAKGFAIALLLGVFLLSRPTLAQDFTVNLKDTDIQEFIEFVADVTAVPSSSIPPSREK